MQMMPPPDIFLTDKNLLHIALTQIKLIFINRCSVDKNFKIVFPILRKTRIIRL